MFRSTRSLAATIFRGNITSKRGNKNFYKGRGAPLMGHMTRKGRFIVDSDKFHAKTFTVPDLTACEFKPYVSRVDPAFGKK